MSVLGSLSKNSNWMSIKLGTDHTYHLANKLIPGLPVFSGFNNKRTRVGEETILIYINPIECTGYILRVFFNGGVDPAFHHLSTSPIWEPRLRVTYPTPLFTFGGAGFMVAQLENGVSSHSSCWGSTSGRSIRENIVGFTTRMDAHHLRGRPTAMARMVKHVGEMGGESSLRPPWGLSEPRAQSAQIARCVWMQYPFEPGATPTQLACLLLRAF